MRSYEIKYKTEGMPQWGLLVMLDLLKGWPVVQVSCHVPAVMSFRAKRGSFSIITACTRRPNIKIMCLSRGRKHAGTMRKRFSWQGERSQCLLREFWSIVRPWQNSTQVDLLKQLRRCGSGRILLSLNSAHGTHDGPAGGSSSSSACAIGTHDGREDGGYSPEAQPTFGSPSMPPQVTQEQPEIGALGPQTNDY